MRTMIHKMNLLVFTILAVMAMPALAQKQTPPEGAPAKSFTVPASETYNLPNGMKVTLVPYGIIPKAAVSVSVDAGNINEGSAHVGVADIAGNLLKEGTTTLTSQQLAQESARMGSTLSVGVSQDLTTLNLDVLQEFTPEAVKLLADVLQHPRMPESELARLKNDALRNIAVQLSQPQTLAILRFRKIMYGDHPYGTVVPTENDIQKMSIADIK